MKLSQFLKPADVYFSTPKAARRLLRLFVQLLVFGMIVGAIIFVSSIFYNEISLRQSYMTDAMANARVFFTQREALLKSLIVSSVESSSEKFAGKTERKSDYVEFGNVESRWKLRLSSNMIGFLEDNRINLVHVDEVPGSAADYLTSAWALENVISHETIQRLYDFHDLRENSAKDIWLYDQHSFPPRLYLFTLLDPRHHQSGWLGMEMDASDVSNTLHDDAAGQFMMLNPYGDVIMSSARYEHQTPPALKLELGHDFGFAGEGVIPDQLIMRKLLGVSGWKLFYIADFYSLLKVCLPTLIFFVVLISIISILAHKLVCRIERRLIIPATQRIDALIESEAFSRAVIQTAPVALCVLRRVDGQVVLENRLSEQWLGECGERERLCHRWIERAFDDEVENQSEEFQAGNGRHLYLSFVRTRYNAEDVLFCAFSDISSRKQIEAALAMAKQMADAANEAKTLFLATMSHEIRTPLYGVLGTLELLGKTELKVQQKAYLKAIESSSETLLNLVCDVLDVSKIEAGQLALELIDFSPIELAFNVVQNYIGAARSKRLLLYSFIDPMVPSLLQGDAVRIRQILNNLLNNAVKFTDSGHIILRAKVRAVDCGRVDVQWQVSDSGPGISAEDQLLLFEPFYQTASKTNVVAGTGLGLSICQRLAALMNGNIRVVSTLGLGSSFTLNVPFESKNPSTEVIADPHLLDDLVYVFSPALEMAEYIASWLRKWGAKTQIWRPFGTIIETDAVLVEVHPGAFQHHFNVWHGARVVISSDECGDVREENQWYVQFNDLRGVLEAVSEAQGITYSTSQLSESEVLRNLNLSILVAEDNLVNQLILKDQLEALGCRVTLAKDGAEALVLWEKSSYDVILTDINMPGVNGYELTRELRRLGCTAPIIGATANAMRDEDDRCLSAGMQQLLVKPFQLGALSHCLQQYERMSTHGI